MHKENKKYAVAIVGGKGYSGLELARILKRHPNAELKALFGTKASEDLDGVSYFHVSELLSMASGFTTVFLATPPEVSLELVPKLVEKGLSVIDLSGAFRLNTNNVEADYLNWYKLKHNAISHVEEAHFGLVPWTKPPIDSKLITNPGCYATAVLMGILPLLKFDLIDINSLVIDAKSGATGAGKKGDEALIFSEVDGECIPYKVGEHQHLPEICLYANKITGKKINPFFTTHLLPIRRGIIAGIYARLNPTRNAEQVEEAFREFYANYPLVKFSRGSVKELMMLKKVVGTAYTHITFSVIEDKIYVFSTLDNLLKGAASQAVENFNLLYQLPVTTGLDHLEAIV